MKILAALAVLVVALATACAAETGSPPAQSSKPAGERPDATATATPPATVTPTNPLATAATAEPQPEPTGTPTSAPEAPLAEATPVPLSPRPRQISVEGPNIQPPAPPTGVEYHTAKDLVSMVSGLSHSCGLRADGTAVCWGEDWYGQSSGPVGSFTAVSLFYRYSCGARPQGGIECWGEWAPPQSEELAESTEVYTSLAAGDSHLCALKGHGEVECWTDGRGADDGLDRAPAWEFLMLDAGHSHTCGVRADGRAICWGGEYGEGVPVLPSEQFASLSADNEGYTCGVRNDGAVECWEYRDGEFSQLPAPEGSFETISVEGERGCGIRTGGALLCWSPLPAWALEGLGAPPQGRFTAISVGREFACASRDDGIVVCWGKTSGAMPPGGYGINELGMVYAVSAVREDGVPTYIAVADDNSCQWQEAPQTYHGRFCWGNPDAGRSEPGEPTYRAISVGYLHNCAVTAENKIRCWGRGRSPGGGGPEPDLDREADDPPGGDFLDVAAGYFHTCGLRTDGSVVCWGSSHLGQATSPGGQFTAISTGDNHTCGLRPGGEAVCWGELNYYGVRSGPPGGEFVSIASGDDSTCGIRSNGAVECWGGAMPSPRGGFISFQVGPHDGCGITADSMVSCQSWSGHQYLRPELGPLTALSMGGNHGCGIQADGSLLCWGGKTVQATPPGGRFEMVSTGRDRTCALRTGGTAVCWGRTAEDHVGLVTPPSDHPPYFSRLTEWTERGVVPLPPDGPAPTTPRFTKPAAGPEGASCGRLCSREFWKKGEFTLKAVRTELDQGADPSVIGDQGAAALHWAIKRDAQREIIELLLDRGADPDQADGRGDTPLHYAVAESPVPRVEVIDLLLDRGADIHARNYHDTPVLTAAVAAGNDREVIRALLDRGANPNPGKTTYGDTPLSMAVQISSYDGNPDVVRLLLENGADATERYFHNGVTLLHLYFYGFLESSSSSGDVAPDPEIVRLLLVHGCDPSVRPEDDLFGGTILLWAMLSDGPEPEVISLLLEHGASLAATHPGGPTPLHYAPFTGGTEVAVVLLEYGADVSAGDEDGETPLHYAMRSDAVGVARLLLERGADASAQNHDGDTPLHLIARWYEFDTQARADIVALLIEHGADGKAANSDGETPCDLIGSTEEAGEWDAALREAC